MKGRWRMSLRNSILLVLLVVGLFPVFVVYTASQVVLRRVFEDTAQQMLRALTEETAREVSYLMTRIQQDGRSLRNMVQSYDWLTDPAQCPEELRKLGSVSDTFPSMAIYDVHGNLLCASGGQYWVPLRYTKWFEQARTGEIVTTPPVLIPGTTGLHVCVLVSLKVGPDSGPAVLVGYSPFSRIQGMLRGVRIGTRGWFVLLDGRGNALYHSDESQILQRPLGARSAWWWQARPWGILPSQGDEGAYYAASAVSPLSTGSGEPWWVIGLMPAREVLAPLGEYRLVLASATLATLFAVVGIGILLSRGLAKPLLDITRAAERVAQGDLTVRVTEDGVQELRDLARTFNHMLQDLQRYREHVESIVEHRTARLRESQAQLEERATYLRASLESLIEGVLMVQWPEGRVLAANHSFAELFGLTDKEPLTGRTLRELEEWVGPNMADFRDDRFEWNKLKERPEDINIEEWEIAKPVRRIVSVTSTPAVGPNGVVLARLYMFRDLTEQRQLQEELRQAQKMEAIGRLAGGIAHDFNNLLTGILGNLSMAEMEPASSPRREELIRAARLAGQRASELVRQLLSFSRRSPLRLQLVDINKVIEEMRSLLQHSLDPRIELKLELEKDLWRVRGDPTQIQQVLMNLCVNAMDAMPQGGQLRLITANVRVTGEQARQWMDGKPGDFVRISVCDQGHGISQEVKSHLFEPFFTTKEPGKGTGLGLAMSYGIIKQHDGWIACYSELNRGTTFHIFLPGLPSVVGQEVEQSQDTPVRGGSERVMVVDDEPAVRAVVMAILQRYGYSVIQAAHGEEALHLLAHSEEKPDVIVLDLTMPKLSGPETLKRIRELYPDLLVVVSSGYPIDLESFARETGIRPDGVVQKPYEVQVFAKALREVLDKAKKQGNS